MEPVITRKEITEQKNEVKERKIRKDFVWTWGSTVLQGIRTTKTFKKGDYFTSSRNIPHSHGKFFSAKQKPGTDRNIKTTFLEKK